MIAWNTVWGTMLTEYERWRNRVHVCNHWVQSNYFQMNNCGHGLYKTSISREDGSVVCNCCWPLPTQSFSGPSPVGLMARFYCLRFETPQPGGPGPRIYIPQEQGGSVIPPSTGFPFHRLLRLAGLRWWYLTLPPQGETTDTVYNSLLIWCRNIFCLQYSRNPSSNGLVQVLNSL
jgi:hypothetical protein